MATARPEPPTFKPRDIPSPLCVFLTHCGARAVLGPPEPVTGAINREATCLQCGACGVHSAVTDEGR